MASIKELQLNSTNYAQNIHPWQQQKLPQLFKLTDQLTLDQLENQFRYLGQIEDGFEGQGKGKHFRGLKIGE
jgi:hypothetical protein